MKKFVDPELNVQRLQLEDVIATSNGGVSGDASTGGDDGRQ